MQAENHVLALAARRLLDAFRVLWRVRHNDRDPLHRLRPVRVAKGGDAGALESLDAARVLVSRGRGRESEEGVEGAIADGLALGRGAQAGAADGEGAADANVFSKMYGLSGISKG